MAKQKLDLSNAVRRKPRTADLYGSTPGDLPTSQEVAHPRRKATHKLTADTIQEIEDLYLDLRRKRRNKRLITKDEIVNAALQRALEQPDEIKKALGA